MTPKFFAISYKNKSFESLFSDSEINTFPYILGKPEKQFVMAFKEDQLESVLEVIGMKKENITSQLETERPNMFLITFDTPYEFSIEYEPSITPVIENILNAPLVEIVKNFRDIPFTVSFTNNISSLNESAWAYSKENSYHLFVLAIANNGNYHNYVHPNDESYEVKLMNNFLIPSYIDSEAVIKLPDDTPIAFIRNNKLILTILMNTSLTDPQSSLFKNMQDLIYTSVDILFTKLRNDPGMLKRISEKEQEYKFMEFLSKLVSKRSETYIKRLKELRELIPKLISELANATEEQKHVNSIVNVLNPDAEKDRLLREIAMLRRSEDVKDIVFEADAVIINMKHVMFPHFEKKDVILHCGEMTVILPFDAKKELLVLRSHCDHYPDKMRNSLKNISCAHPNIFENGSLCYGNTAETFGHLRGIYDISSLFIMVNNFIHVYNPKSPTIDPNIFPTTTTDEAKKFYDSLYQNASSEGAPILSYSDPEFVEHPDYDNDED